MNPHPIYKLVSEELRERFGDIYVDTTFQDQTRRIGFLRRVSDKAILTYHIVQFDSRGVRKLGKFHDRIVSGALLGETIKKSGLQHERIDSKPCHRRLVKVLRDLFGTEKELCKSKIVTYTVLGVPYVKIQEFYNPKFTPAST